eukprot:1783894-Amphidinium_carterae.1
MHPSFAQHRVQRTSRTHQEEHLRVSLAAQCSACRVAVANDMITKFVQQQAISTVRFNWLWFSPTLGGHA